MAKQKGLSSEEHRQRVQDFCEGQIDLLLDKIKKGQSEKWVKPWGDNFSGLGQLPHNPKTNHRYSGANLFFLTIDMILKGVNDPRYMTLGQAKVYAEENGLDPNKVRIIKGSKAAMILQPIVIEKKHKSEEKKEEGSKVDAVIEAAESGNTDKDKSDDVNTTTRRIVKFKTSPRFNGSQLTGIPDYKLDETQTWSSSAIVDHLLKTNKIAILSSNKAAFCPSTDNILMPDVRDFENPGHHTSTALHEFYHWTGSQKREKRISDNYKEFRDNYAKEEIRAQFFMLAASAVFGIPVKTEPEIDYIQHFSGKDGLDYRAIYKEFAQSSKMFNDMLVPFILNEQPAVTWFPAKETWPIRSEEAKEEAIIAEAIVLGQGPLPDVKDNKWYSYEGPGTTDTEQVPIVEAANAETLPAAEAENIEQLPVKEKQWHHYGVKHPRGVGLGASPKNHVDYQISDKFLGGIVTYAEPLSDKDISHYTYEPLGTTEAGQPFIAPAETAPTGTVDPFDLLDDSLPTSTDAFDLLESPQEPSPQAIQEEQVSEDSTDAFDLLPEKGFSENYEDFGPRPRR